MPTSSLLDTSESGSAYLELQASTDPVSGRESVRVIVMGSPKGVAKIIHTLHVRGFAEVTAWSPPIPTNNPGQVMRILILRVLID